MIYIFCQCKSIDPFLNSLKLLMYVGFSYSNICLVIRKDQVIIFRIRTGHNRLRHHMHSKRRICPTDLCPCGNAPQTTKHILQECRNLADKRLHFWPTLTNENQKLFGCLDDLQRTAEFIASTGLLIWRTERRRKKKKKKKVVTLIEHMTLTYIYG